MMALRDQPYLPLYVQDYLTDEKLNMCSPASQGVYIKIMCIFHKLSPYGGILLQQKDKQNENICQDFAVKLARLLPFDMPVIELALTELLEEHVLSIENDFLFQKRMVADNALSKKRSEAGTKGGFATAKLMAKDIAKTTANTEDEDETNSSKGVQGGGITPKLFEDFWELYPKKIDKGKAISKWNQICSRKENRPTWKEVYKAIQEQIKTERWQTKKYIPHPTTWLNQSRWLDDPKEMIDIKFSNTPSEKIIRDGEEWFLQPDGKYRNTEGTLYRE